MIRAKATRVAPRGAVALTGVFVFGLASVLTGCTATAVSTQSDGRVVISGAARLDEATDSVGLPMDKYAGPQDTVIFRAQQLAQRQCMIAKGFTWQVSTFQGVDNPVGFRGFGLWDMTDAVQYGYGIRPDPAGEAIRALNHNLSTAAQAAADKCSLAGQAKFVDPRGNGMSASSATSASSLSGQAFRNTLNDPTAKKLITAWQKCMTSKAITLNAGRSGPLMADVDVSVTPLEQQIKIAVQEVTCKTTAPSIIQQLVDIEASYEMVSIGKYQTVLNAQLAKFMVVYDAAKKYIADNG